MTTLFLFIVLALLVWLIMKPSWMPAPPENALTEKIVAQADRAGQVSVNWYGRVKSWFQKPASLGVLLKNWSADPALPDAAGFTPNQMTSLVEFRAWFVTLPQESADQLAEELDRFCRKQGVNIRWVLDDQGRGDMQAALAALVLFYGLAVRERTNALPAAAVREWEDAPLSRQNRRFGILLFTRLVETGVLTVPANMLFATEKERLAHMIAALKSAAAANREAVLAQSARVLEEMHAPKAPKAKKAAPLAAPITVVDEAQPAVS
jgi:hypothetical protein